jgi:hypothetical protein
MAALMRTSVAGAESRSSSGFCPPSSAHCGEQGPAGNQRKQCKKSTHHGGYCTRLLYFFGGLIMMCAPAVPGAISHGAPSLALVDSPVDWGVAKGT